MIFWHPEKLRHMMTTCDLTDFKTWRDLWLVLCSVEFVILIEQYFSDDYTCWNDSGVTGSIFWILPTVQRNMCELHWSTWLILGHASGHFTVGLLAHCATCLRPRYITKVNKFFYSVSSISYVKEPSMFLADIVITNLKILSYQYF